MYIFLILLIGSLSLFCLILILWSYQKWNKGKRIITRYFADGSKTYYNLKVSSASFGKFKVMPGFKVQATILMTEEKIIIAPLRMALGLFQTELPVEFNKQTALIPSMIKVTTLDKVIIECQKNTFSLGRVKVVFEIDTNSCNDKSGFIENMKEWWVKV
jgi:hypothetical protein